MLDPVAPGRRRQLVGERADREGVEDVLHRALPADPHMHLGGTALEADVGDGVRQVGQAEIQLPGVRAPSGGVEGRHDRREHACDGATPRACRRSSTTARIILRRRGVVVSVPDVVLAGPGDLDGGADRLRDERRLGSEIGLRLAPEGAAQERHVRRDVGRVHADGGSGSLAQGLAVLAAGPDLGLVAAHVSHRRRHLHGRMHEMRRSSRRPRRRWQHLRTAASMSPSMRRILPGLRRRRLERLAGRRPNS